MLANWGRDMEIRTISWLWSITIETIIAILCIGMPDPAIAASLESIQQFYAFGDSLFCRLVVINAFHVRPNWPVPPSITTTDMPSK
jgi:hypothetical protein